MFYQTKHNCSTIQRGNVLPDKSQLFNNTKWKCSTRQNIAVLKYKVEMFSQTKHNCATIKVEMFYQTKHTCSPPYFFVFFLLFCFVLFWFFFVFCFCLWGSFCSIYNFSCGDSQITICPFSFVFCILCSSIHALGLPLWYLQFVFPYNTFDIIY